MIIGGLTGAFITLLINRKKKDDKLSFTLENPTESYTVEEPFDGAILIAGITLFCVGNETAAGSQMVSAFPEYSNTDWYTICRVAGGVDSLNSDLLVECLAAKYAKNKQTDILKNPSFLITILAKVFFSTTPNFKAPSSSYSFCKLSVNCS